MKHNEEDTSDIVREFYTPVRFPGIIKTNQPRIKGASKTKGSTRDGKAEFIFTHENYPDFLLLVEAKDLVTKHQEAEEEVKHYSDKYKESYPESIPITLAISGTASDYKITMIVPNIHGGVDKTFDYLLEVDQIISIMERNEKTEEKELGDIIDYALELQSYLIKISVEQQQRPLMVAAIMIALSDKSFRASYRAQEKDDCSVSSSQRRRQKKLARSLQTAIKDSLVKALPIGSNEIMVVEDTLKFIKAIDRLYEKDTDLLDNPTYLFHIIQGLETHLFSRAHLNSDLDLIGKFFQEFVSYKAGGDGKDLGIVLTPNHITDLMCDLGGLTMDSDVYDPCTGTGGFLVTAMSKMIEMAENRYGLGSILDEKIKHIKDKQIYGVELNAKMYTMALANLIFKGDSHPDLLQGDCFRLMDKTKLRTPNLTIGNPPYGLSPLGLPELKFIKENTDVNAAGGKSIFVVPKSVGTDQGKSSLVWKAKLLQNHTLESVISLPNEAFNGVGTSTIILIIKAGIPHSITNQKTMFVNFEDDGFKSGDRGIRIDKNYAERKQWLLDTINSRVVERGKSAYIKVDYNDEWGVDAHTFYADYSSLTSENFVDTLRERIVYEYIKPKGH